MDHFIYRDGALWCDGVSAEELATRFDTPLYVYAERTLVEHYRRLTSAFAAVNPLICFAIKACQNVHVLQLLREQGSGFDVVSGGELHRALRAGARPESIVYAGVGKTERELIAALDARIGLFNVESASELGLLDTLAATRGRNTDAAVRLNPDVDAGTHAYTATGKGGTKFGVGLGEALRLFAGRRPDSPVRLRGVHMHIGSPVYDLQAYADALDRLLELIGTLRAAGHEIDTLDVGGGFGANYRGDESPPFESYAETIVPRVQSRGLRVILEPGRSVVANGGILLTRVVHVKESAGRRIVVVDAAMTDLIRPALYGAYHFVWPTEAGKRVPASRRPDQPFEDLLRTDVVGPVCESGDFLAQDRALPAVARGDLLAVFTTGAYAMVMASQYNSRPRAAEVLVTNAESRLIRRRETYADLLAPEDV